MKIEKDKIKMGVWYEDENGKVIRDEPDTKKGLTYHSLFPLEVTEHIYRCVTQEEKKACKHKRKYHRKERDLIKGYKGRSCKACGCTQVRKWWEPWGKEWDYGTSMIEMINFNTNIGSQDVILAMANSGDYTLKEAIAVYASACERCMNVLAYKYLNGEDGYPEHSEEWYRCNTICDFCKE